MNAVVVYESLWGNTAAVAAAIAEGIGHGARALSTAGATPEVVAGADLLVAGSPVLGFKLPTEKMREGALKNPGGMPPRPADLSHPSVRSWLETVPRGQGMAAAFDTQVRGPFGKAAPAIAEALEAAGYRRAADPEGFVVSGRFGPLREGELERARRWGADLAAAVEAATAEAAGGAGSSAAG